MQPPILPADEPQRLAALRALDVLDTPAEERFDRIVRLAKRLLQAPIVLVSLVDAERQWFKARVGIDAPETPRDISFCGHAIVGDDAVFEVPDASTDDRFADNPLVTGAPGIRFYAGAVLRVGNGQPVGTLCLIDQKPRQLNAEERQALRDLADLVEVELQRLDEQRWRTGLERQSRRLERQAKLLRLIGQVQADFIAAVDVRGTWQRLLHELLALTESAYGFIGEARHTPQGHLYLHMWALTDLSWDGPTRALYDQKAQEGFEFHNLDTLFGHALRTRELVLTNDAPNDPRRGGLPPGHPPLERFLGVPFEHEGELIGMVGLANRPGGYDHEVVELLQPLLAVVGQVVVAARQRREHERQRRFDPLTGLYNRLSMLEHLRDALHQARLSGTAVSVAYIDLDGFKVVNDAHGHAIGDQLLVTLTQRLRGTLRAGDVLARLGGDEFVAILEHAADRTGLAGLLQRMLSALSTPVPLGALTAQLSGSIGVSTYPQEHEVDAEQLLRQADQAMYQAKTAGKNRFHEFDPRSDASERQRHTRLARLTRALERGEFRLHYQPKVRLRTGELVGAEALIRWQHPEDGLLSPAHFLPVLQGEPLDVDVGRWVIRTALEQMAAWQQQGLSVPVSVNVSVQDLLRPDFAVDLQTALARHGNIPASALTLEVLETSALEDIARASQTIAACQRLGVTVALDDFGTGYSSLSYLKQLGVRELKIDQSFVRDMLHDPDDLAILEGVLGLARAFRCQTVAEGVETEGHGRLLLQLGYEIAQGYYIARPMPADALPGWLTQWRLPSSWQDLPPVDPARLPLLYAAAHHRAWVDRLTAALDDPLQPLPELDDHACELGRWLDAWLPSTPDTAATRELVDAHRQVHELAMQMAADLRRIGPDAANRHRDALHALRDRLLAALDTLAGG